MKVVVAAVNPAVKNQQAAVQPQVTVEVFGQSRALLESEVDVVNVLVGFVPAGVGHAPHVGERLEIGRAEEALDFWVLAQLFGQGFQKAAASRHLAVGLRDFDVAAVAQRPQVDALRGTAQRECCSEARRRR
jgi:hypothetical protein